MTTLPARTLALLALALFALPACGGNGKPSLGDTAAWRARMAKGDFNAVKTLQAEGAAAVPLLEQLLRDDDVTVVTTAALVVPSLGPDAKPLVPALLAAVIRFPDDPRHLSPLREASIKPVAAAHLLDVLANGDPVQQAAAVNVLTHYARLAAPGMDVLVELLAAPDEIVRLHAMNTLAGIGIDAEAALPALEAARDRTSGHEKRTAEAAIKRIRAASKPGSHTPAPTRSEPVDPAEDSADAGDE